MKTIRLANGKIVTGGVVVSQDVILRDGVISLEAGAIRCDETVDITGKYVVPGFVDIHFHGYNMFDFTYGRYDAKKKTFDSSDAGYDDGFTMLGKLLPRFGVTSYYLATIAAPVDRIKAACGQLRRFAGKRSDGAKLMGALLEGTFINPKMCGAQNPAHILEPSVDAFKSLEGQDVIKMVNLAPECGKEALELIRYLSDKNIAAAAGHCAATGDQIDAAVKAGLKYFVHFLNGPTGHNFKPFDGGGAVEAVLRNESLYVEQIVDGFHIAPSYVRDVINRKGIDKVVGITDALYAAGTSLKQFDLGGIGAQMSDSGKFISVVGKPNTLCSSVLTMDKAFQNVLNWLTVDMPGVWNAKHKAFAFDEAIAATAKICSTNPSMLLGIAPGGSIAGGNAADLCVLDISGKAGGFGISVDMTVADGKIIYQSK